MTLKERIRLIPRQRREDARGWLLKIIDGGEPGIPAHTGEAYVTLAHPGQKRGGHYHRRTHEWFTVLQGDAEVRLADPGTGEQLNLNLRMSEPMTLFVPAGVAHSFGNGSATGSMVLAAYASERYDPADTVLHEW
jgi:dTDP-4-dehydrorhamnose 3,5-epimerase-like enzyme